MENETKVQETAKNITRHKNNSVLTDEQKRKKLAAIRDENRQLIRGIFYDNEIKGGESEISFRLHANDGGIETRKFRDGDVYEIPLGLYKHFRDNCWYPIHEYAMNEKGVHMQVEGKKIRRFGFQAFDTIHSASDIESERVNNLVSVSHF